MEGRDDDRKQAEEIVYGKVEGVDEARRRRKKELSGTSGLRAGDMEEEQAAVLRRKWSRGVDDVTMADGRMRRKGDLDEVEEKKEGEVFGRLVVMKRKTEEDVWQSRGTKAGRITAAVSAGAVAGVGDDSEPGVLSTLTAYGSDSDKEDTDR
jgi:hypothetical protein